jgi:hypothetical protein
MSRKRPASEQASLTTTPDPMRIAAPDGVHAEHVAGVIRIHQEQPRPTVVAAAVLYRWVIPQQHPPVYAHAAIVGASVTLCGGLRSIGALYPPHEGVPRCDVCAAHVAKPLSLQEDAAEVSDA